MDQAPPSPPRIGVVLGSASDIPRMEPAFRLLEDLGIPHERRILSAHRTPEAAADYARSAAARGLKVILAAAGMAAHLPGVLAAHTLLPVVGVPLAGSPLSGWDALLSIVQMPPGIPVAAVAVDGARNGALLAAQILALQDSALSQRLTALRAAQAREVEAKDRELAGGGPVPPG